MPPLRSAAKSVNVRLLLSTIATILVAIVTVVVVHRIQIRRNAEGLAELARTKLKENKPRDAIGLFARYLTFRPNDAVAQAELARLLVARLERPDVTRGDLSVAYDALERAVSLNPDDRGLRTKLADFMLRSGRFGAAGQQLDIVLEQGQSQPDDAASSNPKERVSLLLMRARAYVGVGRYPDAAEILAGICGFDLVQKQFLEGDVANAGDAAERAPLIYQSSVFLSALLDEKIRDVTSSRVVLDHLVDVQPGDFRGWLARANWCRAHGDFVQAAKDLAKARELSSDDPAVLFTSFEIALAQDRFAEAEQLVLEGRRLFPKDERVYRGIAAVAVRQGDFARAAEVLQEGLDAKVEDVTRIKLLLIDVFLKQGNLAGAEEAIASYTAQHGGGSPDVGLLDCRLLIAQGRWLPAKKKLESIRPLVATSTELTKQVDIYLAKCHEQLGDFDEQLAATRRVLSEDHESLLARIGAASALASTGRPDEALAEYEAIATSLPPEQLASSAEVWNPLLQLRVAAQLKRPEPDRDWSRADELIDLLEQSPVISTAQLALLKSDALIRKGKDDDAEALLREHVAEEPQNAQLTAALTTLLLRHRGVAAARTLLDGAPAEVRDSLVGMTAEAQIAARLPADESAAMFAALEAKAGRLPDGPAGQILSTLGAIRHGGGNAVEAERLWKAALEKRPEDLPLLMALLELAYSQREVEKAAARAADITRVSGEESPPSRIANASAIMLRVRKRHVDRLAEAGAPDASSITVELSAEDKQQLTAASNLLVEAENTRPGWVRIQRLFAEIAILRGDVPDAIQRLQRATRMGATDPALLRQLLSLLYLSNRLEEAQQTLARLGPDRLPGLERLSAEIELSSGRFDDAVALAERSVDSTANATASDLLWFGQILARAGKFERATDVLQRAVAADRSRAESWLALLSSQIAAGQRQAAEKTLDEASTALEPPRSLAVMAQGSEMLGRIDDAERYFREAFAAESTNVASARSLASFLVRSGRLTAAKDELRRIIALPEDGPGVAAGRTWARRALAVMLPQSGSYRDLQESLGLLDQNVVDGALPTEDLLIKIDLLAARAEPGQWRKAVELLDQLSKRQSLSNAQRLQRAQLLERCGRWEDARSDLVALATRPNTQPAMLSALVEKLVEHGEYDAARAWLKKLDERIAGAPAVFVLEAKLALAEGDRPKAVEAARKLMPSDAHAAPPEHIGAIASLMEQSGFTKAADKAFEQFATATKSGVAARAAFLGRQRRVDEAFDLLERQWDDVPLLALMQTAVYLLRTQGTDVTPQQRERVARWFAKAERQDPGSVPLQILVADMQSLEGDDERAIATYRQLLDRADVPPVQAAVVANNLAFLLARPETAAEAETLVERALVELGPSPDVLDTRGVVLLAAGKTGAAIDALTEAALVPTAAKYLHLACALAADRQLDAARKAFDMAKTLGLDPPTLCSDDRLRLTALESDLGS